MTRVTVGDLRRLLDDFNEDATVVMPYGFGYEEPRLATTNVRAVAVPQRYVGDPEGPAVVVLRPVNG